MAEKKDRSNLAGALARAQLKIQPASRTQEAPGDRKTYRYADLSSVREACREALASEGLAFLQLISSYQAGSGTICVECVTLLMHGDSGEELRSPPLCLWSTSDPHSIGSAMTYARRYSLMATLGIAPEGEDDDAQKIQAEARARSQLAPARPQQPQRQAEPKEEPKDEGGNGSKVNIERLTREIQRLPENLEGAEAQAAVLSVLQAWPGDLRDQVLMSAGGDKQLTVGRLRNMTPERKTDIWQRLRSAALRFLEKHGVSAKAEENPAETSPQAPEKGDSDPVGDFLSDAKS